MRKILLAVGVASAMIGISACQGGSSAGKGQDSFGDSLAVTFGNVQGSGIANQIEQSMPEEQKAKFNSDSFLRGFKQAIMTDTADEGYIIGLSMGLNMFNSITSWEKQGNISFDRDLFYSTFAKAFKSPASEEDNAIATAEMNRLFNELQTRMQANMMAQQEAQAAAAKEKSAANVAAGEKYIADLKAKDKDIKTTESGLSYKVVKQGTGATPKDGEQVKVIYTGTLIDGTEFDSSKGNAVNFDLNQVIPGFSEGLKLMPAGSKYILYIPADLAYGDREAGTIPPGSTLIFDVEIPAN